MIWRRDAQAMEGEPALGEQAVADGRQATAAADDRREERDRRDERKEGPRMAESGEVTVVGQGAKLEGTIVSAGSLRIDGQVRGQINADGDVLLTQQSQVEADIRAKSVSIAGRFRGNVAVSGKTELKRGGRIEGNITSKSLVIEEGGIFDGQCIMEAKGAQQQAVTQAQAAGREAQKAATDARSEVRVP